MEEELKARLSKAISEFNNNRYKILKLAYDSGGNSAVQKAEEEYDALRDAYFEILRRQLDKNNHLYEQLIKNANTETNKLTESIQQLENINKIIELTAAVVNLIGRIIITLGI